MSRDGLVLGLLPGGVPKNWRDPRARGADTFDGSLTIDIARRAEAAKIHTIFVADTSSVNPQSPQAHLEPLTLLSALAQHTERIGLVGTASSSWYEPYTLARLLSSLDHLSGGRAGWNVVTSAWGKENFGGGEHDHDDRYARAEEFVDVVTRLWDSWDDDALDWTGASGGYVRADRVRPIDWAGERFTVKGPLNIPRSPQGRPLIAQAGASEPGRTLGARVADVVFATGVAALDTARRYYADMKARVAAFGRDPDDVRILPGVAPIIGSTDEEARRIWDERRAGFDYAAGVSELSRKIDGFDLADLDPDAPITVDQLPPEERVQGYRSQYGVLLSLIAAGELRTLRDVAFYHARSAGHWVLVGSPGTVADALVAHAEHGAADGFALLGPFQDYPDGYDALFDGLVPELRRRGVFHREYAHTSLRANLGLPDPGRAA